MVMKHEISNAPVAQRENTPLENFIERIDTLSDRTREQKLRLQTLADRILGSEEALVGTGPDRPPAEPGEYNTINYAIDTLCMHIDGLSAEIEKITCRF